ncbi:hypothetical protein A3C09_04910 [Candidatus Uhrbacteria bacterium RIFCSPHIGHO2_02_FULL_47_44]|nr:MAG: hypothetical protein A3C09_04910 [Candidatus Uhrbacteria bacterium RIFCSPHIGHO2_02_FULL_47_44]
MYFMFMTLGKWENLSSEDVVLMDNETVRQLRSKQFSFPLTPEAFDHFFYACDALWLHSGDPKDPHAELTSGKCSNGFVDTLRVLRYTNLCELMARQIVDCLHKMSHPLIKKVGKVDWIIGSDHASAVFSYEVARRLGCQHDFTEKGSNNTQVWKRFQIDPNEVVLQVEELVTTTTTLSRVRSGVRFGNPTPVQFAPLVFTLVHRSKEFEFEGTPIHYVRHYDIDTWEPKDCPLCAAGSKRLKPKANWAELTGKIK